MGGTHSLEGTALNQNHMKANFGARALMYQPVEYSNSVLTFLHTVTRLFLHILFFNKIFLLIFNYPEHVTSITATPSKH